MNNASKSSIYSPDLPWNCYKPQDLGPTVMGFVQDHEPYFRRWAQVMYENYQFLFGNHNIKWSRKHGFALDYDYLRSSPQFGLRAYTNLARSIAESLASFIFGTVPDWETEAMGQGSTKGRRLQKITQRLLEAYMVRLLMHKEGKAAAMIYTLFGQMSWDVEWNRMAGKIMEIPRYNKGKSPVYSSYMAPNQMTGGLIEVPTQMVDDVGEPVFEERWEKVLDQMGRQVIDRIFAGDVGITALTPFEYRRQLGQYGMHRTKWVQRFKLMDYDEFLDQYKETPGATELFKRVRPVYSDPVIYNMAIRHFMRMQFTTPPALEDGFNRSQNIFRSSLFKYKVYVVEHWDKPHNEKWPEGRRIIVANGDCTHISRPNYFTNKMDGWHQLSEAQWLTAPPSSMSAGPMNDVIRKNREVNVKDSLIATAVRRNMGSQLLVATGAGIDLQKLGGEPGVGHMVGDINGARWLHDEMPIPPVITRLREMDKEDVYESSGAVEALRGQPSTGATSGYQERQREEREEKRLSPARIEFEDAFSGAGEKIVACLRANAVKLDDSVMGFMKRSGAGEFSEQDVVAFLTTQIDYGVDIKVSRSSMLIKSKGTAQANLAEAANGPAAQRIAQDAGVLDEYLKFMEIDILRDDSSVHRDRAERENESFLDMLRLGADTEGIAKPIVLFEDDDDIHLASHTKDLVRNFDEYRNSKTQLFLRIQHMEQHRIQKEEKLGQLMPGASTQTSVMMNQASQSALPTPQTVMMDSQARKQNLAQQQAQQPQQQPQQQKQPQGNQKLPNQSPRQPSGPGGGSGNIDPSAPSKNTPSGAMQGGIQ